MRYFISVGEPSGQLHGCNLMTQLRKLDPNATFVGFGSERMQKEGCELLYPLAEEPIMGIFRVILKIPFFKKLLNQTEKYFIDNKPDAVILIDNPGFNWEVAKRAHQLGIPVYYYVPPQIWAWLSRRVWKVRKWVDQVFCNMPFEEEWYKTRGVDHATYLGYHPYFDELTDRQLDEEFIKNQKEKSDQRVVAILPGSRTHEVNTCVRMQAKAAQLVHEEVTDTRFLIAGYHEKHRDTIEAAFKGTNVPWELHVGRTPEIIEMADSAISVSGSVSLELMYHCTPTSICYHIPWWGMYILKPLLFKAKYITLVNFLAEREIFPERFGCTDLSHEIAKPVIGWMKDHNRRHLIVNELKELKDRFGKPGASQAAAKWIAERHQLDRQQHSNLRKAS